MSVRKSAIALALATMAVPAAFAQSASVFVGGEAGWVDRPVQSALTREQVCDELLQIRSNPVARDCGRFVGDEAGYVYPLHTDAYQNGQRVRTDKIAHNPKPNAIKTPGERRLFLERYPLSPTAILGRADHGAS